VNKNLYLYLLLNLVGFSIVYATDLPCFPICSNPNDQSNPAINGNIVVWQDNRNGSYDIYRNNPADLNDLDGLPVCTADRDQKNPVTNGSVIVWQDTRNSASGYTDIYGFDLTTNTEFPVRVDTNIYQENPAISGRRIVWQDERNGSSNKDIFGFNLDSNSEFQVCTASSIQSYPDISGSFVVWQDYRNGVDMDIYARNIDTGQEFPVCTASGTQQYPAISGNIIVWEDYRNGNADIYGYNISTAQTFPICTNSAGQYNPAISGDIVVWEDARNGDANRDIYGYKISTATEFSICTVAGNQQRPAVSGNLVVWQDYRNGNSDIYGAYIPDLVNITVDLPLTGQTVKSGGSLPIQWHSTGPVVSNVSIEYTADLGQHWNLIADNITNKGSFTWNPVSTVTSQQCQIRVSQYGYKSANGVSKVFTIYQCSKSLTADLNGDCFVNFADFAILASQWFSCGAPGIPNVCPGS
jgi:TolB protein